MRAMGRLIICLFMSGSYSGSYIKKPTFINTPGSTSSHQSWPWTTGIPFSGQGCPVLLHLQWGKPYGGAVRVYECWCIRSRTMKAQCWATFHGDPGSQAASLLGLSRGPWRPLPDHPALTFRQGGREWCGSARFLISSPGGHVLLVGSNPQAPPSGSSPPGAASSMVGCQPWVDSSVPATLHAVNRFCPPTYTPRVMKGLPP